MKFLVSVVFGVLLTAGAAYCSMPALFMDFDDDGVADETIVDSITAGIFEQYNLYIGVDWDTAYGAMEYQVIFTGTAPPAVETYFQPGDPTWALAIGTLTNGGWFQSGPCRGTGKHFIAKLTGNSFGDPGTPETFKFEFTSAPYDFPGLFQVYTCVPLPVNAYSMNSAAVNGTPPEVAAEPVSWGTLKNLLR
jgi:hypothetical protein